MYPSPEVAAAALEQIERDLRSARAFERGEGMRALLRRAVADPSLQPRAREVFRAALGGETDPWALSMAALGIETLDGATAGGAVWRELLGRADENVVAYAVIAMRDAVHAPLLRELLERRPEPLILVNALSALGRLRDRAAMPAMLAALENASVRPHAISALADLGDPGAIAAIERYLNDRGDAWPVDNHGPMMSVGEVAAEAIAKLRQAGVDGWSGQRWTDDPSSPDRDDGAMERSSARPRSDLGASIFGQRLLTYLPLVIACFELIWVGALVQSGQAAHQGRGPTTEDHRRTAALAILPPLIGLGIGILMAVRRWPTKWLDRGALLLGVLICGLWALGFAGDLLR
ncbi:MAG: HEAT repeat domain-containing protein [Phycisphaerae bacterium]|nr:HEAT repeat domain-containing protein [Phycisphaerae bacterium]